jgi:1-acyl-sn-glycerol-3-phosphate acyltransferase
VRVLVLLWTAIACLLDYFLVRSRRRGGLTPLDRAQWLHKWCVIGLRRLHVRYQAQGPIPQRGLLVSNHLSYLDIMVLSALEPCAFVSKKEVRSWPLFGRLATLAGTIYIDRERSVDVVRANHEMRATLEAGVLCVLFPEGTSSDGSQVLPFRAPLLEAAVRTGESVTAAYIRYEATDADIAQDICYWGEMSFVPHLLRMLSVRSIGAVVRFAPESCRYIDRKQAATATRNHVIALKDG